MYRLSFNQVVSEKVCKSSLSSLFILFIFLPFVSRISIDKFSLNMLFLFLSLQHLLVGKVPTCLMALMFSFYSSLIFSVESFNPISRIYTPLHLHRKVHICKVSDVAVGFILFQYWVFLFSFGYKSNK